MSKSLAEIRQTFIDLLKDHLGQLKITADNETKFEVTGTIEAMQGKKKVDGFYFATVVPKPKDVRFYFFPTYTHRDDLIDTFSDEMKKCLKGKSCFHVKSLSPELEEEFKGLIAKAIKLYQKDGLLVLSLIHI